jgi:hypothetical protein
VRPRTSVKLALRLNSYFGYTRTSDARRIRPKQGCYITVIYSASRHPSHLTLTTNFRQCLYGVTPINYIHELGQFSEPQYQEPGMKIPGEYDVLQSLLSHSGRQTRLERRSAVIRLLLPLTYSIDHDTPDRS